MMVLSEASTCSFIADLKPRIPSPIPLPSSGSFLGPNTSNAIPKITNRCVGCNSPSNMNTPFIEVTEHLSTRLCRRRFPARETASSISGLISEQLSRQDLELFCRNGLDRVLIELQMRINHFRREPPDPLVERQVQDFARLEQLQKHQISIASVFHVMTSVEGNEADVVGIEVHGTCRSNGHKHRHSPLPRHPELPLRGVGMPMELAHASGLDRVQGGGNILRDWKVMRVDDAYFATGSSLGRRHRSHFEGVLDGRLHFLPANCRLVFCQ